MTPRLLPLAVASWLLSLFLVSPAAAPQRAASDTRHPHAVDTLFSHSENCMACHNSLVSPSGEDVSIGSSWRSTMMANSARDPYWQASVRRETIDHPSKSADIQDECSACHMPMAQREARAANRKGEVFSFLPFNQHQDDEGHRLAADGVSCSVCHQIAPTKLGSRESFNGQFLVNPPRPDGIREIFGPYAIDAGRRTIMRSTTGFEQTEGAHVRQSELCATCHTLITEALGPDGRVIGSLPEQMNYQEWRHSAFYTEQRSCQSCHMPAVSGPVRASSVLGEPRPSLSRHAFVGGNAFMVRMLNRFRSDLGVEALPAELEATARATERQLQQDTATVAITRAAQTGSTLALEVDVRNLTGHKFPTGYPARRAWLHVVVRQAGRVVFESGAVDESGQIRGNDNDASGATFEPHYAEITDPGQVQVYESVMGTPANAPTTGLLQATQYLKDNRLLPRGFDKATADREIAVAGGAATDADFTGGGDKVRFRIALPSASGAIDVEVTLLYQSIGYRWAHNLDSYDAPEPKRFVSYYGALSPASSVVVSRASIRPVQ